MKVFVSQNACHGYGMLGMLCLCLTACGVSGAAVCGGGGGERGGAGAYLTDLEVELAPPLLRLEAEHGGEHRAQRTTRFHVHEHFHLLTIVCLLKNSATR